MPKRPGVRIPIERLQTFLPLAVYLLITVAVLWSAFLFASNVVMPLTKPKPLDQSTVLKNREKVNRTQFTAATDHFPTAAGTPKSVANPFGR